MGILKSIIVVVVVVVVVAFDVVLQRCDLQGFEWEFYGFALNT